MVVKEEASTRFEGHVKEAFAEKVPVLMPKGERGRAGREKADRRRRSGFRGEVRVGRKS
jgi:hypothetical protein